MSLSETPPVGTPGPSRPPVQPKPPTHPPNPRPRGAVIIERLVAEAPPLTDAQLARLTEILRPCPRIYLAVVTR